jgi:hypothetical protein
MSHFDYEQKPEHPDYERLSRIVDELDAALKAGRTTPELLARMVDLYSAQYLAEQRATLACAQLGLHTRMRPFLTATFLNAFAIGVVWEQDRCREREWEKTRDRRG